MGTFKGGSIGNVHLKGVKDAFYRILFLTLAFWGHSWFGLAQCEECDADPNCSSSDGFPTLCPLELPAGIAGEAYESVITFFLPAEITDPGSGLVATLNSVNVASITGLPPGMDIELDDPDGFYEPASGQNSGCATLCGVPTFSGVFEVQISIMAVVTALGFEQDVPQAFSLGLIVEPGAGGTSSFSFSPSAGCGVVLADFEASVFGEGNQITDHTWVFDGGNVLTGPTLSQIPFDEPGAYEVVLETTILNQVLDQVQLFSTGGGGWDDFFGNPDPYFTLKDGNESVVYTSSTLDATTSGTWGGLGIVLSNPPYSIDFYDEDLLDGDDWLGWAPFSPNGPGTIGIDANPSNAQLTIGLAPVVMVSDTAQVLVNPLPEVGVVQSDEVTLTCTEEGLIQYQWWLNGDLVFPGSDPDYAPSESGWYVVSGLDSLGCSAESDSLLFCMPNGELALELVEANGSPMALVSEANLDWWLWQFNGEAQDTLFAQGDTWFPLASGWYQVQSESALGCSISSDSLLVCWPVDVPEVIQDEGGNLVSDSEDESHQWWNSAGPIEGATESTLPNPGEGVYTVWVTDFQDCPGVESVPVSFVGIEEAVVPGGWKVWPNPFLHGIEWQVQTRWLGGEAVLRDASGRIVARHAVVSNHCTWDLTSIPAGPYLLHLTDVNGGISSVQRLLKN